MKKRFITVSSIVLLFLFVSSCQYNKNEEMRSICDDADFYYYENKEDRLFPFIKDSFVYIVLPSFWKEDRIQFSTNKDLKKDRKRILHSKLPSVFITTESGSMESVDNSLDKSVREGGIIKIVNTDGTIEYNGELTYIKGRGNSTWVHKKWSSKKKPYNIKLKYKSSIFDFRKSKKYCLLANAEECCPIRNFLTYNFAKDFKMPYSIGVQPVVLWLNGNYQGLYLLTEKVNAGKAGAGLKVQIDSDDGGVMLEGRSILGNPIQRVWSTSGTFFGLKDPDSVSENQLAHIQERYRQLEISIESNPACGNVQYFDTISFAKYYLLQEIFANNDAFYGSYYFYKDADVIDSLFYAGPLWDMDNSLSIRGQRISKCPTAFYAKSSNCSLYRNLCNHLDFWQKVKYVYQESASPLLKSYFDAKLDSLYDMISEDVNNNNLRWPKSYSPEEDIADIKNFMHARIAFLDHFFSDERTPYLKVIIHRGPQDSYMHPVEFLVVAGDTISLSELNTDFKGFRYLGCYDEAGTLFDARTPISKDINLYMRWESTSWIKRMSVTIDDFRVRFGAWRKKNFK